MRAHQRILDIWKQSRIGTPRRNIWFYKEEIISNQSPVSEAKSIRNDRLSIFNDDYTRYSQGSSSLTKTKRECSFVVDWQLEDVY